MSVRCHDLGKTGSRKEAGKAATWTTPQRGLSKGENRMTDGGDTGRGTFSISSSFLKFEVSRICLNADV